MLFQLLQGELLHCSASLSSLECSKTEFALTNLDPSLERKFSLEKVAVLNLTLFLQIT